jgi:preprotein translocase subunit SecA
MIPYIDNSLRAHALFHKDKEYVVENGQEIVIVDEFTGRLMHGRRFSEGLHQAIEAKEGVQIRRENVTMATITFQNFFRMYSKLGGMTGTAMTEAEEFEKIYNLEVVAIPTNREMIRLDYEDLIFPTIKAKFDAVVAEIKERQAQGQPILVGTVAVETSEMLSSMLKRAGIKHQVLNAKNHEREAEIITQAGRSGTVTIATNMAGRGVDILLGGNPEGLARQALRDAGKDVTAVSPEEWQAALAKAREECAKDREIVLAAGGLLVIGTERHEARRIDNQLRGRAGRQGDPGESRFFISLEDDLMRRFGGDRVKSVMQMVGGTDGEPLEHSWLTKSISQAQVRVEGYNFDIRKRVLEYDDVVNKQREVIYRQRRLLLKREDLREDYLRILEEQISQAVDTYCPDENDPESWELEALYRDLLRIFPVPEEITPETMRGKSLDELEKMLIEGATTAYDRKIAELGEDLAHRAERWFMLQAIDRHWRRNLTDLDILREGIGLMAIAQRDPLVEYKRQAYYMYETLQQEINVEAVRGLMMYQRPQQSAPQVMFVQRPQRLQMGRPGAVATAKPQPVRKAATAKLGRNDKCHCGSGKKYKDCHMREDQMANRVPKAE